MTTIPDAAIEQIVYDCSVEHEHPRYGHGLFTTEVGAIVEGIQALIAKHLTSAPQAEGDVREAVVDALVMSPMSDSVGTEMGPIEKTADEVMERIRGLVVPVGELERVKVEALRAIGERTGDVINAKVECDTLITAVREIRTARTAFYTSEIGDTPLNRLLGRIDAALTTTKES